LNFSTNYQSAANFTDYDLFQLQCGINFLFLFFLFYLFIISFFLFYANSFLIFNLKKPANECLQISFLENAWNSTIQYENNGSRIGPFRENQTQPLKICELKGIYRNWDNQTQNLCQGLIIK